MTAKSSHLTTTGFRTATPADIASAVTRLIAMRGTSGADVALTMDEFEQALTGCSVEAIGMALDRYRKGQVSDDDGRFMPTTAQFRRVVDQCHEVRCRPINRMRQVAEQAERKKRDAAINEAKTVESLERSRDVFNRFMAEQAERQNRGDWVDCLPPERKIDPVKLAALPDQPSTFRKGNAL